MNGASGFRRRETFERIAQALNITLRAHAVRFPEREVVLALSEVATLDRLVAHSDVVAELRRASLPSSWVSAVLSNGPVAPSC
jgi:hypothetical protein